MDDNGLILISCKPLKSEYEHIKRIAIPHDAFTIGRAINSSAIIPHLSISRSHCTIRRHSDEWIIEDNSTYGIEINGKLLGKGSQLKLQHEDVITLDPCKQFVYKCVDPANDTSEIPKKKMKFTENSVEPIDNNVLKLKFEESQSHEMKHIEDKLHNAKQMQTTSRILKDQLQLDMNRKIEQLEKDFALQIENLKGEKDEVERQKVVLTEERDALLTAVKQEMEGKITELMMQIKKHNETETELLNENNTLKEKLEKEREEFLSELSRESSSKQDMLDKLQAKMREQEEIRLKEKQELEELLKKETEALKLAKERELNELQEQKKLREQELVQELNDIKKNFQEQVEQTELMKLQAEQQLNEQMEKLKQLSDQEKAKMDHLIQEREEIQRKLAEAESNVLKAHQDLKARVNDRETELAALANERIQRQADQSSEVITALQVQLENVKSELQSVEVEKNMLLENLCLSAPGEGTSKQTALAEVSELMESELQCSICAELFITAITLNCSHTFCKYCITMWKKKKKDCPICRAAIISECKSLVLDSFIEKMVQNLSEDMKKKRQDLLSSREELESQLARQLNTETGRGSVVPLDSNNSDFNSELEEEESEDSEGYHRHPSRYYATSDTDSGSDESSFESFDSSDRGGSSTSADADPARVPATAGPQPNIPTSTAERTGGSRSDRARRGRVAGTPGSYYGGYGRCFSCGARGHWAPGCPFR